MFIANEVVSLWLKSFFNGVFWKLDSKKTYDHVNWGFLLIVIVKMSFWIEVGWVG